MSTITTTDGTPVFSETDFSGDLADLDVSALILHGDDVLKT